MAGTQIHFHDVNRDAANFPKAKISPFPVPGRPRVTLPASYAASNFLETSCYAFRNGRSALTTALRLAGVEEGAKVLFPGYHCGSMIEPAMYLKAEIGFVNIHADLEIDLDHLKSQFDEKTRAVVIPHYFGIRQRAMPAVSKLCSERNVLLIEDCAHAFLSSSPEIAFGVTGAMAIACMHKFYPTPSCGLLRANSEKITLGAATPASLTQDLREYVELVETADRSSLLYPLAVGLGMARPVVNWMRKRSGCSLIDQGTAVRSQNRFKWLVPQQLGMAGPRLAQGLVRRARHSYIVSARRRAFERLDEAFKTLAGATPMFPELPAETVPYVYPLVLKKPEAAFRQLKAKAVPLFRWEELAANGCRVSNYYRERLVQLPCHQSLRENDVEWLIKQVREVLA